MASFAPRPTRGRDSRAGPALEFFSSCGPSKVFPLPARSWVALKSFLDDSPLTSPPHNEVPRLRTNSSRRPKENPLRPVQALATPQDCPSDQEQQEQSQKQLQDFLRGGQDVAEIMSQMANLLEDIQGFEEREEALAVEMAAAAAVAGRLEVLDRNFLLAVDFMSQEAMKQQDSQQVWLLQTLKQQVLFQLESRFPPQVEVVAMLVTTEDSNSRHAILRRAAAAAAIGANRPGQEPGSRSRASAGFEHGTQKTPWETAGADAFAQEEQPDGAPRAAPAGVRPWPDARGQNKQQPDSGAAAVWIEEEASEKKPQEIDDGTGRIHKRVPAAPLEHIIAQADDLIAFMEEDLPVRDRRLLSRLVLAREEARGMMSGGYEDARNDVRKLQNLPEAEVRFLSQLTSFRDQAQLRQRILEVMHGKAEGEHTKQEEGSTKAMEYGAPVRPGHFLDSVTKVIVGIYKTGGGGFLVQQLENIRQVTLDVLQEIGHGK